MLTKKNQELLNSHQIIVEKLDKPGYFTKFNVHMNLTHGQFLTLQHLLEEGSKTNAIASDLNAFLQNALARIND